MSLLAIVAALVGAGGICLWVAGLLLGGRAGGGRTAEDELAALVRNRNSLRGNLLDAHEKLGRLESQMADERTARRAAEDDLARAETEMERAAGELGRAEAELSQSGLEIARLEAQLAATTRELADTPTMPPDPLPGMSIPPISGDFHPKKTMAIGYARASDPPEAADTDNALADLDLERVAHTKTRQALDEAQARIELLERERAAPRPPPVPASPNSPSAECAEPGKASTPPPLPPRDRKGAGFQTVSIASRDQAVPGFEHDRLRQAHEQLRLEKERIESEHAEALTRLSEIEDEPETKK